MKIGPFENCTFKKLAIWKLYLLKIGPFQNWTFWKLGHLKIGPFKNWTFLASTGNNISLLYYRSAILDYVRTVYSVHWLRFRIKVSYHLTIFHTIILAFYRFPTGFWNPQVMKWYFLVILQVCYIRLCTYSVQCTLNKV